MAARDFYIGIDNGVSGSIAVIGGPDGSTWCRTPVRKTLNYTKKKGWVSRIDRAKFKEALSFVTAGVEMGRSALALLERPMINSTRFQASISAARCLEATIGILEDLRIPYQYVDSREWQKVMLPSGVSGEELKAASLEVAKRLFPKLNITTDGDAVLMAEWARREEL